MHSTFGKYSVRRYLQKSDVNATLIVDSDSLQGILLRSVRRDLVSGSWMLRMEHEARRLRQIANRNYNPPIDVGVVDDWAYLAYRWVDGKSLDRLLSDPGCTNDGSDRISRVLSLAECVLNGLKSIHDAGLVHRDIRPSHIIQKPNGAFVLCGYGPICIAEAFGNHGKQALEFATFSSPELAGIIDHDLTPASDLYSLGVVLFTSLMQRPAFEGQDVGEILFRHLTQRPSFEGLSVDAPEVLLQFINRLLEKETRDRYQSASSALTDLMAIQEAVAGQTEISTVTIGRNDTRSELTDPSFVGRSREMAMIENAIAAVAEGEHRSLIAIGKSGMGKSRLFLEAIRVATRRGFSVYRSVASDQATQEPLGPLLGIVDHFAKQLSYDKSAVGSVAEKLREFQGEISTAMTSLAKTLGWKGSALAGPAELGQGRMVAAFCRVLEVCAKDGPVLLCVDDCQWLDMPSIRVLEEFTNRKPANVFLLIGSRPDEGVSAKVQASLADAQVLEFGGLERAGIYALIESMAGRLPSKIKRIVAAMSQGSPFLATAAMRGLVESKALIALGGGWSVDEERLMDFQAAGDSANVLLKRLEFVDSEAAELIAIGAVIGKQFDIEIPLALTGATAEQVFSRLTSVRNQGLIWNKPNGMIAFVHDKIREAVISKLNVERRCDLHRLIAEYLQRRYPSRCFDLAYHFDSANLPQSAWPHALAAAGQARTRYALDTAEAQYRIAARALAPEINGQHSSVDCSNPPATPFIDPAARHAMESGLADVLLLLGKYDEAEHWLGRSLASAPTSVHEAKVRFKQGDLAFKRGDKEQALQRFEQALEEAGYKVPHSKAALAAGLIRELCIQTLHSLFPTLFTRRRVEASEDTRLIWKLHSKLAHCYWYVRDKYYTLWAHLRELNAAEIYEPTLELAQAYSEHAPVMSLIPWQKRGLDYARRSLTIRKEAQDLWGQGQSRNFLSIMFYSGARFEECMNQALRAVSVLERTGDYWEVHMAQYQAAASMYRLGRLKEALEAARSLYQSAIQRGDDQSSGNAMDLWARASLGKVPEEIVKKESSREFRDHQGECHVYLAVGVQHQMAGRFEAAIECFQKAVNAVKQTGVLNAYITPNYAWLVTALRCQFEANPPKLHRSRRIALRKLRAAAKRAVRIAKRFRNELPHALRELAAVEAMLGSFRKATRLLEQSIEEAREQEAAYELAQSKLFLLQLRHECSQSDAINQALHAAREQVRSFEDEVVEVTSAASLSLIDRFEILLDAGRQITAATNGKMILERTLEATRRLLRGDRVLIVAKVEAGDGKAYFEIVTPSDSNEEFDPGIIRKAEQLSNVIIERGEKVVRHGIVSENTGTFLCCPIFIHEKPRYFLYVANTHFTNLFGSDEGRIASYLSSAASGALERADGFSQLQTLNESLENRVQERTEAVVQRSLELEQTANELRETQVELERAKTAAEKASESKSSFLACMSHEIRTPMSAVLGFTEILLTRKVTPQERERYLQRIHANGQHLLSLLNDVLDFSKIEADHLRIENIVCMPCQIVSDAVNALASRAEEKGIRLGIQVKGRIPEFIQTDPTRLRQIVMNLVGNALKFTSEGSVQVTLSLQSTVSQSHLRIEVADTGIGICKEQLSGIFEPFTQADASTSRQFGGTGLGLSISKRLAEALGGSIEFSTKEGKGSIFSVTIATGSLSSVRMIDSLNRSKNVGCNRQLRCGGDQLRGRRILVVDDVEANREMIAFFLNEAGAEVIFAMNGQQAIEAWQECSQLDLICMDMQMPVLDGYAATRQLREAHCRIPVIAMTANNLQGDEEKCLKAGCDDYLSKPIDFEKLLLKAVELTESSRRGGHSHCTVVDEMRWESGLLCPVGPTQCDLGKGPLDSQTSSEVLSATDHSADPMEEFMEEEMLEHAMQGFRRSFLMDIQEKWDHLESVVEKEDLTSVKEFAHWIRGTGGTLGFDEIADCMEEMERVISGERPGEIKLLFESFVDQYQQACVNHKLEEMSEYSASEQMD